MKKRCMHLGRGDKGPVMPMKLIETADAEKELSDAKPRTGDELRRSESQLVELELDLTFFLMRRHVQKPIENMIDRRVNHDLGLARIDAVGARLTKCGDDIAGGGDLEPGS